MIARELKKVYWHSRTLLKVYRAQGLKGLREQFVSREPLDIFFKLKPWLEGKCGLEMGGPTPMFARRQALPIYTIAKRVDNCNFQENTFWQGQVVEGPFFRFDWRKRPGHQYVIEAANPERIPSASYDFILSSHNIEHLANPISALYRWLRILREDGWLVLVVPHKDGTFDHRRPVTSLRHLIQDHVNQVNEDDTTHLAEILSLHDLDRDKSVQSFEEFRDVAMRNVLERRLHHHVFDTMLVMQLLDYVGLEIFHAVAIKPFHIIAVAKKVSKPNGRNNRVFLSPRAEFRRNSPFSSDRVGTEHETKSVGR